MSWGKKIIDVRRAGTLEARPSRANEFAQRSDVWSVGAHTTGIHGQSQHLCLLDTKAGVVKFCEAVAFRRHQAVAPRQIHRPRRPMRASRLSYDIEEIVPVSPIPHNSSRAPGKALMHRHRFRSLRNSRPTASPPELECCKY